jgi:glucosamine-6-phosphate deaminase
MSLVIEPTAEAAVQRAIAHLVAQVQREPTIVLGLATGRTMVPLYRGLVAVYRQGKLSFSQCQIFNLDEYCGLPADDPRSFRHYMEQHLFQEIDCPSEQRHLLNGNAASLVEEVVRYEAQIRALGGIDLQILGLGENGHIAFNEPGSPFDSRTRRVQLSPKTRLQNAFEFNGDSAQVPASALTMGIGTILEARQILLLTTGAAKAEILQRVLEGPISSTIPATALRHHSHWTIICDASAAVHLTSLALEP